MSSDSPSWREYYAPDGRLTKEDFDAMPLDERIALLYKVYASAPAKTYFEEHTSAEAVMNVLTSEHISSAINTVIKTIASEIIVTVVDEVVPESALKHHENDSEWQTGFTDAYMQVRLSLLSLAATLTSS